MQRFYFQAPLGGNISVSDFDFFHQISHVLRSRIGDSIVIFNGDGFDYEYKIEAIGKKEIALSIISKTRNHADPEKKIVLCQAMPNKYEKIEYIIQKGVEVGIFQFIFFPSKRSQKLIISENKKERFLSIAKEALEQSGGNVLPEIIFSDTFPKDIKNAYVCHTRQTESVSINQLAWENECAIFVGPEGGFSEEEIREFKDLGYKFLYFGERILRTETTGVVLAFSVLQGN